MSVTTKKGDRGTTGLFRRKRVLKNSKIIEAIGAVDELNSYLGICIESLSKQFHPKDDEPLAHKSKNFHNKLLKDLQNVQKDLFVIGAALAQGKVTKLQSCKENKLQRDEITELLGKKVKVFEREIDKLEAKLPVQKNFVLPGGSEVSSHLFYARALARKAERRIVGLKQQPTTRVPYFIIAYLNRLSDYLFILARSKNIKKHKEVFWKASR
jgi:cob(I)alamin adenosyltransferase